MADLQMVQAEGKLLCLFVLPFNLYDISTKKGLREEAIWDTEHLKEVAVCVPPVQNLGVAEAAMGTWGPSCTSPKEQTLFLISL